MIWRLICEGALMGDGASKQKYVFLQEHKKEKVFLNVSDDRYRTQISKFLGMFKLLFEVSLNLIKKYFNFYPLSIKNCFFKKLKKGIKQLNSTSCTGFEPTTYVVNDIVCNETKYFKFYF